MGRPSKFTDEVVESILTKLENGLPREVAAEASGVGRTTFYRWLDDGAKGIEPFASFRDAVTRAIAIGTEKLFTTVTAGDAKGVSFGPARAAAFMLERTRGDQFAQRINVKVSEAVDRVLEVVRGVCSEQDFERVLERLECLDSEGGEAPSSGGTAEPPADIH